jgi:hypothetical protein
VVLPSKAVSTDESHVAPSAPSEHRNGHHTEAETEATVQPEEESKKTVTKKSKKSPKVEPTSAEETVSVGVSGEAEPVQAQEVAAPEEVKPRKSRKGKKDEAVVEAAPVPEVAIDTPITKKTRSAKK